MAEPARALNFGRLAPPFASVFDVRRKMKKWMIGIFGALFALLISAGILVYVVFLPIAVADGSISFAGEMKEFALKNSLTLPRSWSEFMIWRRNYYDYGDTDPIIDEEYLEASFRVRHYDLMTGTNSTIYIEVIDPDLKGMEGAINRIVNQARYEAKSEQIERGNSE